MPFQIHLFLNFCFTLSSIYNVPFTHWHKYSRNDKLFFISERHAAWLRLWQL